MSLSKISLACMVIFHSITGSLFAGTIFQSGTLGPTNIPRIDVGTQVIPGINIRKAVFNGVRFKLTQPAITTRIGGHFVGPFSNEDTFFGAIVSLDGKDDFPNSSNLASSDVLGTTLLSFPEPSNEVFGNLELSLQPGWFAVVFGSGLFGATGNGAAVRNSIDLDSPSYINWQPNTPDDGWSNLDQFATGNSGDLRFVVEGTIIPEPSTLTLLLCCTFIVLRRHSRA